MEEQRNYINDEIRKVSEVPESLEPQNVEKKLNEHKRSRIKLRTRAISAAAAVAIAAGALGFAGANGMFDKKSSKSSIKTDSAASQSDSNNNGSSEDNNNGNNDNKPENKELKGVRTMSYKELNSYIAKNKDNYYYDYGVKNEDNQTAEDAEAPAAADTDDVGRGGGKGGGEHSDTYEQIEGVAEADIVKTDGNKVFYITNGQLFAFEANNGQLTKADIDFYALIKDGFEISDVRDMYLNDGTLTVVVDGRNSYSYNRYYLTKNDDFDEDYDVEVIDQVAPTASVITFNVNDINNIFETSRYTQQGSYIESRMIGSDVYLTTYTGLYYYYYDMPDYSPEKNSPEFVPAYSVNGQKNYVAAEDILVSEMNTDCSGYTVVSSFDTATGTRKSGKAKLGSYANIYMTADKLYMFNTFYTDFEDTYYTWKMQSQILSFNISDGNITTAGNAYVDGSIADRFWLGNCGDTFCAAVHTVDQTNGQKYNYLYTFDGSMNVLGKSQAYGTGEDIKSVTYRDNIAYVVTFIQTDPLYAIDVSDPYNPTILSELKMPGFSTHMRAYTDGRMIGFGSTADEENGVTTGIKLSMYNTLDPNNVTEMAKVEMSAPYRDWEDYDQIGYVYENYYSAATYDEKALLIDAKKNIIAFPFSHYREEAYDVVYDSEYDYYDTQYKYMSESGVMFYSYDDATGFTKLGSYVTKTDSDTYYANRTEDFCRIIYIDDVLYLMGSRSIVSVSMKDFSVISTFSLEQYLEDPYWFYDELICYDD